MLKKIPKFHNEDEERAFWIRMIQLNILVGARQRGYLSGSETSTKTISLRLPESMLDELRQLANKRDVPYQSLIKTFLRNGSMRSIIP